MEKFPILIKSRLNNFSDLELIICTVKSLRNLGIQKIRLYVPYFIGSRSDRQFDYKSNNYLKDVICPIINSLQLDSVNVVDPHSDVLEACLNNFKKRSNYDLVKWALTDINNKNDAHEKTVFISPDAGASKKIQKIAEQFSFTGSIITCSKERDSQGKLIKETSLEDIRNKLK